LGHRVTGADASVSGTGHSQLAAEVDPTPKVDEVAFSLAPGGSKSFKIPASNQPVEVQIDNYAVHNGIQTPSELFSALVNLDANGSGMSWNGTNSDGTSSVGSSPHGDTGPIVTETCGSGWVKATLNVTDTAR
jgi:hypothetical protein